MANNVEIFGRNYNNGKTIAIKTDGSGSLTTILEGLNSTGTELNQIVVNDDGSINVVGAGGGGGNANLYNGAGTTPITATTIDTKNGIDVNIIGGGGGGGGNANLFNGAGTIPITATTIDDKSGIDTNIVGGTVAVSTLPDIAITNTSFEVSNFPEVQEVSGTVDVATLPAIAITNTSFEVSNFPATQPVSGTVAVSTLPAIAITNTSFEVSNFPPVQEVSGTVDVATLPAIAITNTSFEVSNFPTTQPVSGSVSVSNFPATQPVSGTVAVSTLPAIAITNTSFEVSNFPTVQEVSGTVDIATLPAIAITNTSFEVSNFPTTQPVSGSVSVSNFPATQPVSGTVAVSTLPAIAITNTSFEVSNFPTVQEVSGTVDIATLPAIAITNTSFEVSNFPTTQPVSGSVSVSNFPATQPVSGTVAVSTLPAIAITNTSFEVSNFPPVQEVSGTIDVATLPAIAITNTSFDSKLRDGNNNIITSTPYGIDGVRGLDVSIKNATIDNPLYTTIDTTTLPLNTFVTNYPVAYEMSAGGALSSVGGSLYTNLRDTTGNAIGIAGNPLNVEVSNSIVVEPGTNPLDVNITGGTITGADGKAYLYSGNEASAITATTVGGKVGIDSNIINSSIDSHIYGSSDGTAWHHIKTNNNGVVSTNAVVQGSGGIDITSTALYTKTSLDTASDMYADFAGTRKNVSCDTNGKLQVNSFLKDGLGNNITSTDTTATTQSLDTASCLYTTDASVRSALTSTTISSKRALDVNVANTSAIPVSGTFYQATQPVSIASTISVNDTTTQGKIDTTNSTLSTIDSKIPSGLTVTSSRLLSNSQASAYNPALATIKNLTCETPPATGSNTQALHTIAFNNGYYDGTGSYVDFSMSAVSDKYCLNVYSVPKVTKYYSIGGIDYNSSVYRIIGGNPTASGIAIDSYDFGLANPRVHYATLSTGVPNTNLYIDYVNSSGNLVEDAGPYALVAGSFTALPSMLSVNKFRTSTNIGDSTNTGYTLYISPTNNTNRSTSCCSVGNYGIGIFTVPIGYIGYISSLSAIFSAVGVLLIVKWNINGVRQVVYKYDIGTSLNVVVSSGYEGTLGGLFTGGESIAFVSVNALSTKIVQASMTIRQI